MADSTTTGKRNRSLLRFPLTLGDFGTRGFRLDRPAARAVLETAGRSHVLGLNLEISSWRDPHDALSEIPEDQRGYAYEGAALWAALLDRLTLGRAKAFARLLAGPGDRYIHLVHIGAGWVLAPFRIRGPVPLPSTPLWRWFAVDGSGFAEVYFGGTRALLRRARKAPGTRWAVRIAGCGRALWFAESADPEGLEAVIAEAPDLARPHLWSGVGLACTYNGGSDDTGRERLIAASGKYYDHFAQGVVFAARARIRQGHVPDHTERACTQVLDVSAADASSWAGKAEEGLLEARAVEAFVEMKSRVRQMIATRS